MRRRLIGIGLGLLALSSCQAPEPATVMLVLIDTDLPRPIQAGSLEIKIEMPTRIETFAQQVPELPAKLRLVPLEWDEPLSVTATLVKCDPGASGTILVRQKVSGIRFVQGERRVVGLTLRRACMCEGTSCPNPRLVPECADVNDPTMSIDDTDGIPFLPLRNASQLPPNCGGAAGSPP